MTDTGKPVHKHMVSAKEHLAGIKAAQVWYQELMAQHLLKSQDPIKDRPVEAP